MSVLQADEVAGDRPDRAPADDDGPDPRAPRDDTALRRILDLVVVAGCALFVFWQLHPTLILDDTTPAGGDMGAHVWAFAYLRDVLLPDLRFSGWTPDWYAGFPVFHFYMVVPFLGMVALNAGISGVGAIVPGALSAALSVGAARGNRPSAERTRRLVTGASLTIAAAAVAGAWSGHGEAFRFVLMTGLVGAAVVAARTTDTPRRWWLAAGGIVVAIAGIALPYGSAFKLVSVAGVVAMPVTGYLFARAARFPFPTPALVAVALLGFLFDKNFTIYGGNIASTMAGEFAFSISLALALGYLAVLLRGLRDGTHRASAAVLLALVGLCHLIPAFFALGATAVLLAVHLTSETPTEDDPGRRANAAFSAAGAAVVLLGALAFVLGIAGFGPVAAWTVIALFIVGILWWVRAGAAKTAPGATGRFVRRGVGRLWWLLTVGPVAAMLAAWWVLPFFWQRLYLNDMGWEKIAVHRPGMSIWSWFTDDIWPALVPGDLRVVAALALVGAVLSLAFRNRVGSALVVLGLGLALAFVYAPQGRLWNARLLPFWYLVLYLLAAIGVGEVVRALGQLLANRPDRPLRSVGWAAGPVALLVVGLILGGQLRNVPGGRANADGSYRINASIGVPGLFSVDVPDAVGIDVSGRNFVTDWSRWNYSGYEGKNAYPEYRAIVSTMAEVGADRGCGMSLWEYSSDLNDYGTPMALMLLPHWTDGCIGSMEGLYFEASSTTPFHFLMQSELSAAPSRAQRDLPYRELDVDAGVEHLQLMGVRYYLARSAEANAAASTHDDLTEIAASGPWIVYEVADVTEVEPLAYQPAVTTAGEDQHDWLCRSKDESGRCQGVALDWFQDQTAWDVALAASGPSDWERVQPGEVPEAVALPDVEVTDVETGRDGISFRVDQTGVPVLVKESYFPNWRVSGADGPYRVAPNLMVVVPTDESVQLTYGRTPIDWLALLLTAGGIALVVLLARSAPVPVPRLRDAEPAFEPSRPAAGDR